MRGKCWCRKDIRRTPSLRRHYPDQVYGYNLRSRPWPQTPRETLKFLVGGSIVVGDKRFKGFIGFKSFRGFQVGTTFGTFETYETSETFFRNLLTQTVFPPRTDAKLRNF